MRIAYFVESLPPNIDGVSRTYRHLAESLVKKEGEISFVYFSPFKPPSSYLWTKNVISLPWIPIPFYKGYRLAIPLKRKLFKYLDEFKPDILHCSSPSYISFAALQYAKKHNIKTVASFHTDFASYLQYYNINILEKLVWSYVKKFYLSFDMVFAPSEDTINMLKEQGIERLKLWQRGVDTKLFNPNYKDDKLRKELDAKNKPILLFVSRLEKEKGIGDIILANNILEEKGLSFQIIFVGDGAMRKEIKRRLPKAKLLGYKDKEELSIIYASSDIFIFPSITETFGNVIQEALASGVPPIVVNKGGPPCLIKDGINGLIANANDPKNFASKIEKLLKDKKLLETMKKNARVDNSKRSWDSINTKLFEDYKILIVK